MRAVAVCCFLTLFITLCMPTTATTQVLSQQDQVIFDDFIAYANKQNLAELASNARIASIATYFLATPYKGGTLDGCGAEKLTVTLASFDCVTFVESVLALSLLTEYNAHSKDLFLQKLQQIRYRDSNIAYCSRLHYSTDWLHEMQNLNILTDISQQIGGAPFTKKINFITANHTKYPQLVSNQNYTAIMQKVEAQLNARAYYYIPKKAVVAVDKQLKSGDIILITTTIKGLDISHMGIAVEQQGKISLIHASSDAAKVVLSDSSLFNYLANNRLQSGIMVGRCKRAHLVSILLP